jgi:hypothetical protein
MNRFLADGCIDLTVISITRLPLANRTPVDRFATTPPIMPQRRIGFSREEGA